MAKTPTSEQILKADAAAKRKKAAREAAEAQAAADAAVVETPPAFEVKPGQQVPLHILNARARVEDAKIKALNAEAAKAAAVAVNTVLAGKNRPKPKVAAKAEPRAAGAPGTPAEPEGPVKPPKGSTSTRPIPASSGTKAAKG